MDNNARRTRKRWLLVGAVTLLFLATQIYFIGVIAGERSLLFNTIRVGGWMAAEMESELLRFQRDLARYQANPTMQTADDVRTQFDIYWSRIDVATNSQEGENLRKITGVLPMMNRASIGLSVMDHHLQRGLAGAGAEGELDKLMILSREIEPDLRKITQLSIHQEESIFQRERIEALSRRLMGVFVVMLMSGLGLLGVVYGLAREGAILARRAHKAEAEALEARHCLEDALENISDGFVHLDVGGHIQHQNNVFAARYAGMVPVPEIQARCGQTWEENLKNGRAVQISIRPTSNNGIVGLFTDISHLKQIERQLRQQLLAMDTTHEGISVCDSDGIYRYVNRAHARIMEVDNPDDLLGRPWSIMYDRAEIARLRSDIMPIVHQQGAWSGEVTARKMGGGAILQELSMTLLPDGGLICVLRDVSDRKRREQETMDLQAQLYQAQKMDAIGRLAGGIAHDFNNILAAILGYGALLVDDLPEDTEDHQFALHICRSAERARDLVQQILAFSRTQGGSMEMADIGHICQEIIDMLKATLPSTITLGVHVDDHVPETRANTTQIGQVIMNLCVNARDAIGDKHAHLDVGLVMLNDLADIEWLGGQDTERHRLMTPHLHTDVRGRSVLTVGALAPEQRWLILSVQDTGTGIPAAIMERMFEPFFSSKPAHKGTGLGLAAVHGIVAAHHGAIKVISTPGTGTIFEIYLPVTGTSEAAHTTEQARRESQKGAGHILLVDDEAPLADFGATMLRRLGYRVSLAGNGAEALGCLEQMVRNGAPVDLVITDQTMPMMTGTELSARIRRDYPDMPIILCTGYSESVTPETAAQFGLNAFLYKPLSSRELPETVRRVLDGCGLPVYSASHVK